MRYVIIPKELSLNEVEAECRRFGGRNIKVARMSEQVFADLEDAAVERLRAVPGLMVKNLTTFKADQFEPLPHPGGVYEVCQPVYASSVATIWSRFYEFRELFSPPLTGYGLVTAVLDSGIRKTHRTLVDKVTYEANFTDSPGCEDTFNHGTSVAYLIAGGRHALGEEAGMAPGAKVMNIKVINDEGIGTTESVIMGINEVHDLFCAAVYGELPLGDPMYVNAVNMCLTGDTLVATKDGPIPISKLRKGQEVYALGSGLGLYECSALHRTGAKDVYELSTEHSKIKASLNHPFLTLRWTGEPCYKLSDEGKKEVNEYLAGRSKTEVCQTLGVSHIRLCAFRRGDTGWPLSRIRVLLRELNLQLEESELIQTRKDFNRRYELKWEHLWDIKAGDVIVRAHSYLDGEPQPIPPVLNRINKNGLRLPSQTTEDFCWVVGMFLGDGSIQGRGYTVTFDIPRTDHSRNKLTTVIKLYCEKYSQDDGHVKVHSKPLVDTFTRLGLAKKCLEKRIPNWCFLLPKQQKLALLQGILDSDGHKNKHGWYEIKLGNKDLLSDVKALACGIGLLTSNVGEYMRSRLPLLKWNRITRMLGPQYTLSIYQRDPMKMHHFSSLNSHDTKILKILPPNCSYDRVRRVRFLGRKETYDITVDGAHNFVADEFVVHNSFGQEDDGDPENPMRLAIEKLYQASPGKFPVFVAAGNSGGPVLLPAAAEHAWAVGAVTFVPWDLWQYSSRGSVTGLVKPEVVFFGVNILCASSESDDAFTTKSGTSFASPLALGQLCLMREAAERYGVLEQLIGLTYEELEPIVAMMSVKPQGIPLGKTNDWGYGMPMGHLLAREFEPGVTGVSALVQAIPMMGMIMMMPAIVKVS